MGLGQVRDLRRAAVRAIINQRRRRPFDSLRDLLSRVDLQGREAQHLVQCGALDGLGASRADLLAQLQDIRRAGSVLQSSFDFETDPLAEESAAQRLAWEKSVLGWPVSVTPLEALEATPPGPPLADLPDMAGQPVTVLGYRLPGWTGQRGFFLSDGPSYITVATGETLPNPAPWLPVTVHGAWRVDRWGGAEFYASGWTGLAVAAPAKSGV